MPALERCVGDVDGFLSGSFGAGPHRWHNGAFDDLLSLQDVDAQLTGAGLRRPVVRLVRDGEVLDPSTWTRRARSGSTWIDDLVHPGRLLAQFDRGATIVLQSLQRWWPPLTRFCRDLEATLGHAVQANAYLTPPGAAGLAPHHDTHDVFVLQVHGTKHWVVREPLLEAPLDRHRSDHTDAAQQPPLFDVDLRPGDCLYLPRGFIHSATAQQGTSLHLTIGVLATTRHDLIRHLVDRCADQPAFRRALPVDHVADVDAAGRVVKDVVADLVRWLEELDTEAVAADLVDCEARRRLPLLGGHLLELVGIDQLGDASVLQRREGLTWRAEVVDDRLHLQLADRRLDLPAPVEPAVRRLLDGSQHAVGDLRDQLDGGSRLVLARRLVREGVLRTVHDP